MPVSVRLSLVTPNKSGSANYAPTSAQTQTTDIQDRTSSIVKPSSNFTSAKDRKALRKLAEPQDTKGKGPAAPPAKVYERHDIQAGDVVRVKGRVDEWMRGKEWIRQVAVEPASGGSIRKFMLGLLDPVKSTLARNKLTSMTQVWSIPMSSTSIYVRSTKCIGQSIPSLSRSLPCLKRPLRLLQCLFPATPQPKACVHQRTTHSHSHTPIPCHFRSKRQARLAWPKGISR